MNDFTVHRPFRALMMALLGALLITVNPAGIMIDKAVADTAKQNSKSKRAQILSTKAYKIINSAREAMELEQTDSASKILLDYLQKDDRLKPYDKAKALELLTYIYLNQGDYPKAITTAENIIALDILDEYAELEIRYRLIHLYSSQEQFDKSVEHLEIWFQQAENPGAQAFFIAAQIYAMTDQYEKALEFAEQGMEKHQLKHPTKPKESWYRLLLAIYLELKDYPSAASMLEQMIAFWPNRFQYFQQLGALYQELDRGKESVAILSVAYQNALLKAGGDIERLVQMLRFYDYPFKAAVIFQGAIKMQVVKESEQNWEQLANAWMQSREWEKAKPSLKNAARISPTGKHWFLLCQTAFQDEQWSQSKQYCTNAISKGGLKVEEGLAWQLLALARFHSNNPEGAIKAFEQCARWNSLAPACTQWKEHIANTIQNEAEQKTRSQQEALVEAGRRRRQQQRIEETLQL
jgi:tetratricopeptide (TPR) repeat protein